MRTQLYRLVELKIHPETKPEELAYPHVQDSRIRYIKPSHLELPENMRQDEKWLYAMCKAPEWKKAEYMAMSEAWEEDSELKTEYSWCNPLARS